jgi:hypothetical protein
MGKKTKVLYKIPIALCLLVVFFVLAFSLSPTVQRSATITPENAKTALNAASSVLKPLLSEKNNMVDITLSQSDLHAISDAVSYTVPAVSLRVNSSNLGLIAAASIAIWEGYLYLNVNCFIIPLQGKNKFSDCSLGSIPLPSWFVYFSIEKMTYIIFGKLAQQTFTNAISSLRFDSTALHLSFEKPLLLKSSIEKRLSNTLSVVQELRSAFGADANEVQLYIDHLSKYIAQDESNRNVAAAVGEAFALAKLRSEENRAEVENRYALWALSILFGSPEFSRLVALPVSWKTPVTQHMKLRGRSDTRLHFFYSAALVLAGEKEISSNIGKYKEILDTDTARGGSGYSFADLAADKAGTELADFATKSKDSALKVQKILAGTSNESLFIPIIHDLPEGLSERRFTLLFQNDASPAFKQMESRIDARIQNLAYLRDVENVSRIRSRLDFIDYDTESVFLQNDWLTVDTHIHSKYSDGSHTISEIAEKSNHFGCDIIAITDHGDRDFKTLYSESYFKEVELARYAQPNLQILVGLEWNVPPFRGREHVTVLMPEDQSMMGNLRDFRASFDNFGSGYSRDTLTTKPALTWLSESYTSAPYPVLFYNHPSRKDFSQSENYFDIKSWRKITPFVRGFSGAPGHQRNRKNSNGSYEKVMKTSHGWDPITKPGGEWDLLLRDGLMVYGARAPSDFHNKGIDYWPCQFSTTHVYANKRAQNSLLRGFSLGNFWAQHGRFVKLLDMRLTDSNGKTVAKMGESVIAPKDNSPLVAKLDMELNPIDWQGFESRLDEITLVINTPKGSQEKTWIITQQKINYSFSFPLPEEIERVSVRWFGRSIQPEQHHYQFFTNPIMVEQ